MLVVAEELEQALAGDGAVVALETTLIAHGFPAGEGLAVGRASEAAVRSEGALPATVGVLDGALRVGLGESELERFDARARKAGPNTVAACIADGAVGATTVGGTLVACRAAGIRVLATGGIGGVHRGWTGRPDVSADLGQLARTRALVVCSGVKSLLDVPATLEVLETLGVPSPAGGRTRCRSSTRPRAARRSRAASTRRPRRRRSPARTGRSAARGVIVAQPPPRASTREPLIAEALDAAEREGVSGAP